MKPQESISTLFKIYILGFNDLDLIRGIVHEYFRIAFFASSWSGFRVSSKGRLVEIPSYESRRGEVAVMVHKIKEALDIDSGVRVEEINDRGVQSYDI